MVISYYIPANVLIIPVNNIKQATTFKTKIALSFHITPILIQPKQPIKERHISANGNSPVDLSAIANNMINDDVHFMYQSFVSFGVLNFFTTSFTIVPN